MSEAEAHPAVVETAERIASMEVRGATAIADAAAAALRTQALETGAEDPAAFRAELRAAARRLHDTRPTAVSLPNALRIVLGNTSGESVAALRESAVAAAEDLRADIETYREDIGRIAGNRLADGDTLMTHCHSMAVVAGVESAVADGKQFEAYVKETRPRLQGHRTARELADLGVDVTLVVDSAARRYLDDCDHVLVGADSVTADGSVVNKVGTCGLAVNARDCNTDVTVAASSLKFDPATLAGRAATIEHRDPSEVVDEATRRELGDVAVANPAFDVTPPRYVDAIVTEYGQYAPTAVGSLIRRRYGDEADEPWLAGGAD